MDFHYSYEPLESNIDGKYFHHRGPTVYNGCDYDDLDRVTRADYLVNELTNVCEAFGMDDLGNRAAVTLRDGTTDTYAVNPLNNQYDSIDSASLTYDDAGNLTTDKDGYVYTYDYENRITRIEKPDGQGGRTLVAAFDYDPQGRRIRVHDAVADVTTLYYYSDNWQVLSEYDPSGSQQAYYVYGNYIDEALLMHRGVADRFYLHDHLYSPVALLDATGSVIERYEYDAYGKAQILASDFSPLASSQYGNNILYTGRENDQLDNGNLILQINRNRYLSHFMGCWYSPDPWGYVDRMNLHEYVASNPVTELDPSGLGRLRKSVELIEQYLSLGEERAAAEEAKSMYRGIALGGWIKGKQLSSEFLSRWLSNIGGEYKLSDSKVKDIIENTKRCIAYKIKQSKMPLGKQNATFKMVTAKKPHDYFYALGWFQVTFDGCVTLNEGNFNLNGKFEIKDRYDWQDPQGKYVIIEGAKIYDHYATLVENYGLAKRFEVEGESTFDMEFPVLSANQCDCDPSPGDSDDDR